jgi:hypothetical protein
VSEKQVKIGNFRQRFHTMRSSLFFPVKSAIDAVADGCRNQLAAPTYSMNFRQKVQDTAGSFGYLSMTGTGFAPVCLWVV